MLTSKSFNYAEICRQLLQRPEIIRLLTEIHEKNGELLMLARTNGRLLSGLEYSRRFRDIEAFTRGARLGISETRLKALIYGRADPKELQGIALIYWRILNDIPKFNGDSNPSQLQEEDILSVDLFSAAARERVDESKREDSDSSPDIPDIMSLIGFYRRTKHPEHLNAGLIKDMVANFGEAVTDRTVAPLLAILCLAIDYRYVQVEFRGLFQFGNLLLMFLLQRYGFVCTQYASIESAFEQRAGEGEKSFRESTRRWTSGGNDYFPCVHFLLETILSVYRDILNQLRPVLEEGLSRTDRILRFIRNHSTHVSKRAIFEAHPDISLKGLESQLNKLAEEGRIRKITSGRNVEFEYIRNNRGPKITLKNDPVSDIAIPEKPTKTDRNEGFNPEVDPASLAKHKKEKPNQIPGFMKDGDLDPASNIDAEKKTKKRN